MVAPSPTNLLAMPMVELTVVTGTNEDWIDSLCFLVGEGTDPDTLPQLDLTGIDFEMEVRRLPDDSEVAIRASTKDGSLLIGEPPNFGFLIINVSHEQMKEQTAGSYTADIVGSDGFAVRRCVLASIELVEGITRP
jgi:hypothetical protein